MPRKKATPFAATDENGLDRIDPSTKMAQMRRLQMLVNSSIWQDDLEPMLKKSKENILEQLGDRSAKRQADCPDDFLWGRLDQIQRFLDWPKESVSKSFADLQNNLDFDEDGL